MFLYILLLSLLTASFLSVTYFILTLLFGVVWYVLYAFGAYRPFQKAGITGWLAWIPIVNEYFTYKIAWNSEAFIIEAFSNFIAGFRNSSGNKTFIAILFSFVTLVINFIFSQKLAKAFGKSQLFGLGLFFFQPVFIMLLGYGDAEYYGQQ